MSYSTLVSTGIVANHLDGDWTIVDCRYDLQDPTWGRKQYLAGHIPGAVYASLSHDLAGPPGGSGGRHPLPPPEVMTATFGRLGIAPGAQVVTYDQQGGMFASRLWWMLRYMGHDAAAVLDGGWAAWLREERPVRMGEETRAAVVFTGEPRDHLRATADDVLSRLGDPSMLLVDARAPERFEGRVEPLDPAAGHIPGAVNRHYQQNLSPEGRMRPAHELRAAYTALLGERRADEAVLYCGSGVTACHNLLAMEHAGLSGARLYPGSWSEWSSDPARPIESGKSGRSGKVEK